MRFSSITPLFSVLCLLAADVAVAQQTQGIYRSKTASGTVLYTDKVGAGAPVGSAGSAASDADDFTGALQQAVQRYPVELVTSPNCSPCTQGRNLLLKRGVPFREYTISTVEDQHAMAARDVTSLPHVTVGRQVLRGFDEAEWNQYLGAAGYPETSALPEGYRPAAPQPLASLVQQDRAQETASEPAQQAPQLDPSNPTGIRF